MNKNDDLADSDDDLDDIPELVYEPNVVVANAANVGNSAVGADVGNSVIGVVGAAGIGVVGADVGNSVIVDDVIKKIPTKKELLEQYENINTPIIQLGQDNFNYLVSELFLIINSSINNPYFNNIFGLKRIQGYVLQQRMNKHNKILEIIKGKKIMLAPVYLKGGMAYKAYDMFLTLKNDIDIKTPKTVDYDIIYYIDKLNDEKEIHIIDFIVQFIIKNYIILNKNNYIIKNFDTIDETNSLQQDESKKIIHLNKIKLEEYEKIIKIVNNKVLITMYKHPRYRFNMSLRVSVFKNDILERILDITFTEEEDTFKKINTLNIIKVNKSSQELYQHIVPDVNSLLQMSLLSLINRGTSPILYSKCQKDYFRIKYLIDLLENFKDMNPRLTVGFTIGIFTPILNYIISLVPHCIKYIDKEDINTNYFAKFPDQHMIREIIRDIIYDLKDREIDKKKEIIDSLYKRTTVNEYLERNKRKYLKYKQKYLELKKLKKLIK